MQTMVSPRGDHGRFQGFQSVCLPVAHAAERASRYNGLLVHACLGMECAAA